MEIDRNSMAIYQDQILIFTENFESHFKILNNVLSKLKDSNLKVDNKNSHFLTREVVFFGSFFSDKRSAVDRDAVRMIRNYREPRNQRELKQFLNLAKQHKNHSRNYDLSIVIALEKLANNRNGDAFWGRKESSQFNKLKFSFLC